MSELGRHFAGLFDGGEELPEREKVACDGCGDRFPPTS